MLKGIGVLAEVTDPQGGNFSYSSATIYSS